MKNTCLLLTRIFLVLALLTVGGVWLVNMMDSLFSYRSPLKDSPYQMGDPIGAPLTRRLVFVIIDALRLDTSMKPDVMPSLNRLRQMGASASMHSQPPSFSQPGYATLLTGAWPDINDSPVINVDFEELYPFTQDDVFSSVHRVGHATALSAFNWFQALIPAESVDVAFSTPLEDRRADRQVVDTALPWLQSANYQFILIHLDQVDYAGHHEGGPHDPRWDAAAKRVDGLLAEVLATLDLASDTILVVSDHGQIDRGGHGGQDAVVLLEPFVLAGRGVVPGQYADVHMVDIAPTLAALLGAALPASNQGRVLTEMLTLDEQQVEHILALDALQKDQLLNRYRQSVLPGDSSLDSLDAIRQARLSSERLSRGLLAILLFCLLFILTIRTRSRTTIWMACSALVYGLLFHMKFIVLDGRAYSLSSLEGIPQAIAYFSATTLVSFFFACVLFLIFSRLFSKSPFQAALSILDLTLFFTCLLAIPLLFSFFLNGWQATWTLPEFNSAMLAFISSIQLLFVGAGGLLTAGLMALAVFFRSKFLGNAIISQ